jgi:hypothetical protein
MSAAVMTQRIAKLSPRLRARIAGAAVIIPPALFGR